MSDPQQQIDTSGLNCPLPVLKAKKALASLAAGDTLMLIATDPGAKQDIPAFCNMTGHRLVRTEEENDKLTFLIEKGEK